MKSLSMLGYWMLESIGWGLKLFVIAVVLGVGYIGLTLLTSASER